MANKQTDSGRAYNDMLERVNRMSNEITRLADRIKALEERASREDIASELASVGEEVGTNVSRRKMKTRTVRV